jgi:competence protein ComEA
LRRIGCLRQDIGVVMDHLEINNKEATMKTLTSLVISAALLFAANLAFAGQVNINTADAATLASNIKGIGQKKAEAIIAYRTQNGAFRSADELAKVRGIGKKTIEKNRNDILVE